MQYLQYLYRILSPKGRMLLIPPPYYLPGKPLTRHRSSLPALSPKRDEREKHFPALNAMGRKWRKFPHKREKVKLSAPEPLEAESPSVRGGWVEVMVIFTILIDKGKLEKI